MAKQCADDPFSQTGLNLNFDLWNVLNEAGNMEPYRFLANVVDVDAAINLTATAGFQVNLNMGVSLKNGSFVPYIQGVHGPGICNVAASSASDATRRALPW